MSFGCPLYNLSHQRLTKGGATSSAYQRAVHAVTEGKEPDLNFISDLVGKVESLESCSPEALIDHWYALLGASLVVALSGQTSVILQGGIRTLSRVPFWEELQLIPALTAATSYFAKLDYKLPQPVYLQGGAVPYEGGGHWAWADVPFARPHAELGTIWGILALATDDQPLSQAVGRLADWQSKTLDFDGRPLISLFTHETGASETCQLTFNLLLFRVAAALTKETLPISLAQSQVEYLNSKSEAIPLIAVLLELWLERNSHTPESKTFSLSENILDQQVGLTGVRTKERTALSVLSGGRTGLGYFRKNDVSLVNCGPQQLPLGDCSTFGIETGISNVHPFHVTQDEAAFTAKRTVRCVGGGELSTTAATFQVKKPAGLWADVSFNYSHETLLLQSDFFGYEPMDQLAFTFFAKGKQCLLCHGEVVKKHSLDRYQGKAQPISIQGSQGIISIIADKGLCSMQVIPLAGDESYWGADFIISYEVDPQNPRCQWKISL